MNYKTLHRKQKIDTNLTKNGKYTQVIGKGT
jgi:hypothetical protein